LARDGFSDAKPGINSVQQSEWSFYRNTVGTGINEEVLHEYFDHHR
jgi:hypothetical protein